MRNRLKVSPTYEVKLSDVAQLAGDSLVVESLQNEIVYKITAHDKTHVVIDVMKVIEIIQQKAAHIQINLLGSGQTLVEIIYEKKESASGFLRTCMVVTFHWSGPCDHLFP